MPKKRKPATRSATAPKKRAADSNVVKLVTFEITYDAVPDPQIERLPPEDQLRIAEVGERMFQNPRIRSLSSKSSWRRTPTSRCSTTT